MTPARRRLGAQAFIGAFLVWQLAGPLTYYVGRGSPFDPRFAWRMLLDTDFGRCNTSVAMDGTVLSQEQMEQEFGAVWMMMVGKGLITNIQNEMGRTLCRRHPGTAVTVEVSCSDFDRKPVPVTGVRRDACLD